MFGRSRKGGQEVTLLRTEESIRSWLTDELARRIKMPPDQVDPRRSFEDYGLDSMAAVQFSGMLEKRLGRRLSPALLYQYQTIDDLTAYLAKGLAHSDR